MENITDFGERIWAGQTGHFFIVLSFISALLACIAFVLSKNNTAYLKLARISYNLHGFAVIGIAGTLFFMLFNHFFEYQYVYQHSNTEMNMKYILSCFWEGQEGSFLLWTFWNVVLGWILRWQLRNEEWEAPVMSMVALVQVFLASMLLGVYVFGYKIGSNPFLLLREHEEFNKLPFLQIPNYLEKIDGRGLNPLLMNYWMTIHPPTLFLGFASVMVPFAFSLAALWNKKYTEWQAIALPWTYFGVLVLGVGILMGGAWAYEALSFGGFWAWDPVENSSLVPWMVLVAAAHTMIINKNKGGSLFTTHFLTITAFLLILYSTFLTRSGVLGNASVHAFTDLGMTGQLLLYLLSFVFLSVLLLIRDVLFRTTYVILSLLTLAFAAFYDYQIIALIVWFSASAIITAICYTLYFPKEKEEEQLYSREFWMFLGSLLLILSAMIITYFTSVPVINKLFGTAYAPPKVPVYNTWVVPFAILIMLFLAGAQFLKYKRTESKPLLKRISYTFVLALVFGIVASIPLYFLNDTAANTASEKWNAVSYSILLIVSLYAVLANADYWMVVLRGKLRKSGASIAHIGFALLILGALISTSKKVVLSKNTSTRKVSGLGKDYDDTKSILLTRGDTLPMGPYFVTFSGKRKTGMDVFFDVDYFTKTKTGELNLLFRLSPKVQDNPRMGKAPDPDTKHYLNRDLYTHVTYADLEVDTTRANSDAYASAKNFIGHVGDTIFSSNAIVVIDSLYSNLSEQEYERNDSFLVVTSVLRCVDVMNKVYFARPKFIIQNNIIIPKEDVVNALGLKFVFWKINPENGSIEITMSEKLSNNKDFIVMEAYVFPYINILWLGCLVMAFGTFIAIVERVRLLKRSA
ncbi:MAG: cytochrome c biogenesis protein CcsA [Bacteroidia bacterium]|jgi:cytochrome c-type biogenesis protein CcmF|nr:cytochrome c biogenesis protein CcsA [Bacteroidia bacterium]